MRAQRQEPCSVQRSEAFFAGSPFKTWAEDESYDGISEWRRFPRAACSSLHPEQFAIVRSNLQVAWKSKNRPCARQVYLAANSVAVVWSLDPPPRCTQR